jgi:hypothetical protein
MDLQFAIDIHELEGLIDRLSYPLRQRYDADPDDPEVGWIAREMLEHLETFQMGLDELFTHEWDQPHLAIENKAFYYRTGRAVDVFEKHLIPPILRFDETDRFMTRVIAQWQSENNWPDARQPFVIPDSNMFFVSFPRLKREVAPVRVPRSAADDIRAWVLILHEMAHNLVNSSAEMRAALQGDLRKKIGHYFVDSEDPDLAQHTEIIGIWRDAWLEEITCDMVATYVAGKAFSDQALRSTRLIWETIFDDEETHPAWGARLLGSASVLRAMGHDGEARRVILDMMAHVSRTGETPDPSYEKLYPDKLIQTIADRVVKGCQALGIKSFDQVSHTAGVLGLISTAWDYSRLDHPTYRLWESGVIMRVRHALLGPPDVDGNSARPRAPVPTRPFPTSAICPDIAVAA